MKQTANYLLWILMFALAPGFMLAQRTITGTVTDASTGEALLGVTVLVVNQSVGVATGADGTYRLELPAGAEQLRFSYIGFAPQTIAIGSENVINVGLESEVLNTDEVIIIGYGTVKRGDATGSIQTVSSESFNQGAINSPQELVAGKIAGVQITQGAAPGDGAVIRIRGGSSLSASNDPLIVIDGVPVFNDGIAGSRNPLNIINPNDIETFTVLKDASATAIYGSRASNGVILITTKKGSLGKKARVGYNGNFSVSNRANQIDVNSADEFRTVINTQFADGHPARTLLGAENTDWQAQIFQAGIGQDHNLNVSGGIGNIPYRVSVGFTDRNGILKTDKFNRTTAGINLNPKFLNNRLQVNLSFKGMLINNTFADQGAIGNAVRFDPTKPVFDEGNAYGGYWTWTQANGDPNTLAPSNPLALLEQKDNTSTVQRIITNAQFDYRFGFLPELRANLNLGYDATNGSGSILVPENAAFSFTDKGLNQVYEQQQRNELLEFYLNYVKDFSKARIDVMGGYSWQHFFREDYNFATNTAGDKTLTPENYDPKEYYLLSLFGRANISLFDRLLLTFTLRRDGTSRFAEANRWGMFPAAALAYKIIENGGTGKITNLKVRVGYGVTGQQDIGGDFYPYLARYQSSFENAQYQFGDLFYTTLRPNGYDANIKWEETTTYNVALDYGFLDDRITGSVEVYLRQTTDLLNFIPVPAGTNLTNFITTNVGDLENRGVEFSMNTIPVKTEDFQWDFGFNVTVNRNKITRLTATEDPNYQGVFTGGISGGVGNNIQIHSVGFPASSFYVYEQVYDEVGVPIEGLFVDRNGDGTVTPEDRYRFENPAPKAYFGFTSRLAYKNFDLMFAGRANVGNHVYNNVLAGTAYNNLYNSTNIINNVHRDVSVIDHTVPQYFSDHFVVNASFLRFDHITLGYNFSDLGNAIKSLRVYAVAQNPFVITQYEGLDPEVFSGIDGNIYPRSRTFVLGVNANF